MSLYSNASRLYFHFIHEQYLNERSECKYLLGLINVIDLAVVIAFNYYIGKLAYHNHSNFNAMFI